MRQYKPAVMMRAGTSKGLFLLRSDLPKDMQDWGQILLPAMGSPDAFGKQTDGLGGGTSTTSKIAVVSQSSAPGVDIDYTFVAVPLKGDQLDFTGNCGNMLSGVGPFAVEEGLVRLPKRDGLISVVIRNTNTNTIVNSTFTVKDGVPVEDGDCIVDGVGQPGSPIHLEFVRPAGSMTGRLLPIGKSREVVELPSNSHGITSIPISCIDAANPFVFVAASDLGLVGNEAPQELVPYTDILMLIRAVGAVRMGLSASIEEAMRTAGTPKIAVVGGPRRFVTTSGRTLLEEDMDLHVRSFSMGQPHGSLQQTGAVCLAAACSVPGSIPNLLMRQRATQQRTDTFRFAHGSGLIETTATVEKTGDGVEVISAAVVRTARRLFKGAMCYLAPSTPTLPLPPPTATPRLSVDSRVQQSSFLREKVFQTPVHIH